MKIRETQANGHRIEVEFDGSRILWHRVRLIVDDVLVDDRAIFAGSTRLRSSSPVSVVVDATVGFFTGKTKAVLRRVGDRDMSLQIP